MKLPREEVIRRALLAASAVTGRARRFATAAAACSAVGLVSLGCDTKKDEGNSAQATQHTTVESGSQESSLPKDPPKETAPANADASSATPPADVTTAKTPEVDAHGDKTAATDATCIDPKGGPVSYECCAKHDLKAKGCEPCKVDGESEEPPDKTACLTCTKPAPEPDAEAAGLGPIQDTECCRAVQFDYAYGCMAWGPPAPPVWAGRTLDDILLDRPVVQAA